MQTDRQYDLFAVGVMCLTTLIAILFWPELPSKMAIHWSGGTPNNVVAKPLAVFGLLALGIGTVLFVRLAPPSITSTPGGPNLTVLFLGVVIAWVQGIVIVWNLGYQFNIGLAVLPVLILTGLLLAYAYTRPPSQ